MCDMQTAGEVNMGRMMGWTVFLMGSMAMGTAQASEDPAGAVRPSLQNAGPVLGTEWLESADTETLALRAVVDTPSSEVTLEPWPEVRTGVFARLKAQKAGAIKGTPVCLDSNIVQDLD
jgi:hypothetical protein